MASSLFRRAAVPLMLALLVAVATRVSAEGTPSLTPQTWKESTEDGKAHVVKCVPPLARLPALRNRARCSACLWICCRSSSPLLTSCFAQVLRPLVRPLQEDGP